MYLGNESVNPAKFSEAEQSQVKQSIIVKPFKITKAMIKQLSALNLAIEAWYKVFKKGTPVYDKDGRMYSGMIYQQPEISSCKVGLNYVYLRNCNGDLARYVIKTGKIII